MIKTEKNKIVRTERGWIGHFVLGHKCLFRRNTLLEFNDKLLIVSTVGNCCEINCPPTPISMTNYYETMVFEADYSNKYYDINPLSEIPIYDGISEVDKDIEANKMHEKIVSQVISLMETGSINYPTISSLRFM